MYNWSVLIYISTCRRDYVNDPGIIRELPIKNKWRRYIQNQYELADGLILYIFITSILRTGNELHIYV